MTNFRGRPFVFLSEAVLTPSHGLNTIKSLAIKYNGVVNPLTLSETYKQAAQSVKSQAQLFQPTSKFKPAQHREWLGNIARTVTDTITFENSGDRTQFLAQLPGELGRVQNYKMPDPVRQFISNLESRNILWGVVSNEGPMYPAILKYVGASPFCTVQAREGVFKPLPITFTKAFQKVPRESRKNVWFVGSADVQYDNVFIEGARCVLLGSVSDGPSGLTRDHSRIASLDELYPLLDQPGQNIGQELDFVTKHNLDDDEDAVVLTTFRPKNELLPLGEKDRSLADLGEKSSTK